MKSLYSLFLLFLSLSSLGQTVNTDQVRRFIDGSFHDLKRTATLSENGYFVEEFFENGNTYQSYYTPEIPEGKTNKATGLVLQYYKDGQLRFKGEKVYGKPSGTHEYYYPSGHIRSRTVYDEKSYQQVKLETYYENPENTLEKTVFFLKSPKKDSTTSFFHNGQIEDVIIREYTDSRNYHEKLTTKYTADGKILVKNGYGKIRLEDSTGNITLMGSYVDGVKVGSWKENVENVGLYEDHFSAEGKLIEGVLNRVDGKTITYTSKEKLPSFIGGRQALYSFIGSNMRYPKEARDQKLSGQVIVRYTVGPTGEVSNISILKSVHPLLDEEAIRVVKLTNGKWLPGFQRGRAVQVFYTLPINFKTL